jgi:hypothetical protein
MNRAIYSQQVPNTSDNPGGAAFSTNLVHFSWHRVTTMNPATGNFTTGALVNDANKGKWNYVGQDFFDFHNKLITVNNWWREGFNVPTGAGAGANDNTPAPITAGPLAWSPLNDYLKSGGGTERSPIYGYVRLGEFQDANELGCAIVLPYHDFGHGNYPAPSDMPTDHAPMSEENQFWKWHGHIDAFQAFGKDQATVTVGPAYTVPGGVAKITIAFDKPVSWDAHGGAGATVDEWHHNSVQITKDSLVMDPAGAPIAATAVTNPTGDFKTFVFTLAAVPAAGVHKVRLTGTASFASSPAGDWNVTVP